MLYKWSCPQCNFVVYLEYDDTKVRAKCNHCSQQATFLGPVNPDLDEDREINTLIAAPPLVRMNAVKRTLTVRIN